MPGLISAPDRDLASYKWIASRAPASESFHVYVNKVEGGRGGGEEDEMCRNAHGLFRHSPCTCAITRECGTVPAPPWSVNDGNKLTVVTTEQAGDSIQSEERRDKHDL